MTDGDQDITNSLETHAKITEKKRQQNDGPETVYQSETKRTKLSTYMKVSETDILDQQEGIGESGKNNMDLIRVLARGINKTTVDEGMRVQKNRETERHDRVPANRPLVFKIFEMRIFSSSSLH